MDLETVWYEVSPYIYGIVGIAALLGTPSTMGIISGALLIAASATIVRLRWVHRRSRKH